MRSSWDRGVWARTGNPVGKPRHTRKMAKNKGIFAVITTFDGKASAKYGAQSPSTIRTFTHGENHTIGLKNVKRKLSVRVSFCGNHGKGVFTCQDRMKRIFSILLSLLIARSAQAQLDFLSSNQNASVSGNVCVHDLSSNFTFSANS